MHILVTTEDEAKQIIAQLQGRRRLRHASPRSTRRPIQARKTSGGDLGFFKKADMLPEFAAMWRSP